MAINSWDNVLDFSLKDAQSGEITIYDSYYSINSDTAYVQIEADGQQWEYGDTVSLSIFFSEDPAYPITSGDYTVTVYKGYYEGSIPVGAEDITSSVWGKNASGYPGVYDYQNENLPAFTLKFINNAENIVSIVAFEVEVYASEVHVSWPSVLYNETGTNVWTWSTSRWDSATGSYIDTVRLDPQYPVSDTYYYSATIFDRRNRYPNDVDYVEHAVVGNKFYTAQEVRSIVANDSNRDIKEKLFTNSYTTAYADKFNTTKFFTVLLKDTDYPFYNALRTETYVAPETASKPTPNRRDTYFYVDGAGSEENYSSDKRYNTWVMPYDVDGYYYGYAESDENYGFQTVLILDSNDNAVQDGVNIYPSFTPGTGVTVYAGHGGASGTPQVSKETAATFKSGEAIPYSAAAQDKTHLKNYWVTFITQQSGAKLFVNATNENLKGNKRLFDPDDGEDGKGSFIREVYLDEAHSYYHDIFFANIGNAPLTGIEVELDEAAKQSVQLDPYWTVGANGNDSLAAFNTTEKKDNTGDNVYYGELPNVAKVRLIAKEGIDNGEISGHFTIKTGNGGEQRIKLIGFVGDFAITTDSLIPAVKYVPYSTLIQHNAMGVSNAVTFTAVNKPDWLQIKPDGELYGIPMQAGRFTVEVVATYNHNGTVMSDTRRYTLTVTDNTDSDVWFYDSNVAVWEGRNDGDYALITIAIPNQDGTRTNIAATYADVGENSWNSTWQLLETEGLYTDFLEHMYIDGRELTRGTDYTDESGSTRITIRTQTMQSAGTGTHTIAAEFRPGKVADATPLHRAAQNYTVTSAVSSNSGNYNSSSDDDSSTSHAINIEKASNGSISASHKTASAGTRVTITVTPNAGYEIDSVTVTDQNGNRLVLTSIGNGKYTFSMPDGPVTVSAIFIKAEPTGLPFLDVRLSDWFCEYVRYVYENGLMVGTSSNMFSPNTTTSRGMLVTILHRLEGSPTTANTYFSDVPLNQYYAQAVSWAAENGIVTGYGNGRYGPNDSITREQIVTILMNYAHFKGMDTSVQSNLTQFSDRDLIDDYAWDAIAWANAVGVISGKGGGILDPDGPATRAEVATILTKFCPMIEEY